MPAAMAMAQDARFAVRAGNDLVVSAGPVPLSVLAESWMVAQGGKPRA